MDQKSSRRLRVREMVCFGERERVRSRGWKHKKWSRNDGAREKPKNFTPNSKKKKKNAFSFRSFLTTFRDCACALRVLCNYEMEDGATTDAVLKIIMMMMGERRRKRGREEEEEEEGRSDFFYFFVFLLSRLFGNADSLLSRQEATGVAGSLSLSLSQALSLSRSLSLLLRPGGATESGGAKEKERETRGDSSI